MAACRVENAKMVSAVEEIASIAGDLNSAGSEFIKAFNSAIADMQGASKDALSEFIQTKVQKFVEDDIGTAVKGISDLLEGNRSNFEQVDQQLASSISGG